MEGFVGELFHRHDHVSIVEGNVSGRRKFEGGASGTHFLDGKVDRSIPDLEGQGQSHFPKSGIDFLDPILEAVRVEGSHVPGQDGMNEVANSLSLLLRPGMHQDHNLL